MAKILDYDCSAKEGDEASYVVYHEKGFAFPEVHTDAGSMADLARSIKEENGSSFCHLPFCHTVEAEAMGGDINLGNELFGPRTKSYICTGMEEVLERPEIDFSKGRIAEVLQACALLKESGEEPVLEVTGPFTLLNGLLDPMKSFKSYRKTPELFQQYFDRIAKELLAYIGEAHKRGVDIISYADSAGGVNILGPKMMEDSVYRFTIPFLRQAHERFGNDVTFVLCPKTVFALIGCEMAEYVDMDFDHDLNFGEAILESKGAGLLIGHTCINKTQSSLGNRTLKTLKIRETEAV